MTSPTTNNFSNLILMNLQKGYYTKPVYSKLQDFSIKHKNLGRFIAIPVILINETLTLVGASLSNIKFAAQAVFRDISKFQVKQLVKDVSLFILIGTVIIVTKPISASLNLFKGIQHPERIFDRTFGRTQKKTTFEA